MASILLKEQIGYEPEALRLVARKGSGSVRDSLSILSQLLTLGESSIHLEAVREILGVIGHETMQGLMEAFSSQETKSLILLVRDLFTKGLDIGFFLQELAMAWRNMFLLKQTGEQGLSLLEVPLEEAEHWHRWSRYFSLSYIHAAWQLTLEGQRRVVMSIDPSTSLELLLLNIAFLPDLLPIETLSKEQISISDHPPRSTSNMNGQKKEQTDSGSEATGTRKEEQEFPNHRKATDERGYLAECCQTHSKTWDGFLQFLREEKNGVHLPNLQCVRSVFQQDRLELYCPNFLCERLQDETRYQTLKEKIQKYFDQVNEVCVYYDASEEKPSYQELKKKVMAKPLVQEVMNEFKAKIVDIKPREPREGDEQ
jgi:DNA polymerase-3 subunit gamma/tau